MRSPDAQDAETGTRNGSHALTLHARLTTCSNLGSFCTAFLLGQLALHVEAIQKQRKAYAAKPMVWYGMVCEHGKII